MESLFCTRIKEAFPNASIVEFTPPPKENYVVRGIIKDGKTHTMRWPIQSELDVAKVGVIFEEKVAIQTINYLTKIGS